MPEVLSERDSAVLSERSEVVQEAFTKARAAVIAKDIAASDKRAFVAPVEKNTEFLIRPGVIIQAPGVDGPRDMAVRETCLPPLLMES